MNRLIKRTAITISALGLLSVARGAVSPTDSNLDHQSSATVHSNRHLAAQFVQEAIGIVSGQVDTTSASSGASNPPADQPLSCQPGYVVDAAGTSCVKDTSSSGGTGGTGQVAVVTSPPPNPFAEPEACVSISLPFLNNGSKCVDSTADSGGAIVAYARDAMKLVSMAIGGVIVLMIVIAGVQYILALGNPGQITAAKKRLTNAITALVLFGMAYAILNFLIPGGITN
jgi:hypothetical protein